MPIGVALMNMGKVNDDEAAKNTPLEIVTFGHETLLHIGLAMTRGDRFLAGARSREMNFR